MTKLSLLMPALGLALALSACGDKAEPTVPASRGEKRPAEFQMSV